MHIQKYSDVGQADKCDGAGRKICSRCRKLKLECRPRSTFFYHTFDEMFKLKEYWLCHAPDKVEFQQRAGELLLWAAEHGRVRIVQLLLDAGADVETKNYFGDTCLHLAAKNNHRLVAQTLLGAKASVSPRNDIGMTPLLLAADCSSSQVVSLLLRAKADINEADDEETALLIAVRSNRQAVVELLLAAGADPNNIYIYMGKHLSTSRHFQNIELQLLLRCWPSMQIRMH